jgi:hypothetical protein
MNKDQELQTLEVAGGGLNPEPTEPEAKAEKPAENKALKKPEDK